MTVIKEFVNGGSFCFTAVLIGVGDFVAARLARFISKTFYTVKPQAGAI